MEIDIREGPDVALLDSEQTVPSVCARRRTSTVSRVFCAAGEFRQLETDAAGSEGAERNRYLELVLVGF